MEKAKVFTEVCHMAKSKKKPKPSKIEQEIKTYNPTKSMFGKIVLLILAIGFFAAIIISAIMLIVEYFQSL
jgi:uncharacterized membrane protein YcjF (UPF0283 family)